VPDSLIDELIARAANITIIVTEVWMWEFPREDQVMVFVASVNLTSRLIYDVH